MSDPKTAIIVVNWNRREDTLACLDSLSRLKARAVEVVVIDNGSSDGSGEAIRKQYPEATLIETGDNLGYVGGNNLGLEYAAKRHAEYALLLNNDTEVAPDFLAHLLRVMEADPQVGISGPSIYYFSNPDVFWSAGGSIDWRKGLTSMDGIGEQDCGQFGDQPRPVDFVTGCALMIRMPLVEQMGMLDPRFYAYFEETEWCVRARRAGYQVVHVPNSHVWHKISPESREASPQVQYYMTRNRLLFLKLAGSSRRAWLNTGWEYFKRLLSWSLKPRWRYKAPQRQAMLKAILDFRRGRFGRVDMEKAA